jgi:FkbM family methyltransferase
MCLLRRCLELISRRVVLTRNLPDCFGRRKLCVTPGAALAYYHRLDSGRWNDLFDFALHCVNRGDCVWDLGANLGVFAFAAAHQAGPQGEVLAIEADPWLVDLMRRTEAKPARTSAPVHTLSCAVSSELGFGQFITPERARSGSHLDFTHGASPELVGRKIASHPVITVSLDWLVEHRRKPDVIKIDVEGAELAVLQGANKLLCTYHPRLLVEVYESSAEAVTLMLHEAGYELFDFGAGWISRHSINRAVYHTLALPRSN